MSNTERDVANDFIRLQTMRNYIHDLTRYIDSNYDALFCCTVITPNVVGDGGQGHEAIIAYYAY